MTAIESKADPKAKLAKIIEQAKAKMAAIDARESKQRRKDEDRGAIVFSAYARKLAPQILEQAIADLDSREQTLKVSGDLKALKAFKERGIK